MSPESTVTAVLAALEAQKVALLTNWLLAIGITVGLIVCVICLIVLYKIERLIRQTNGVQAALLEATRKAGLFEGMETERADALKRESAETAAKLKGG